MKTKLSLVKKAANVTFLTKNQPETGKSQKTMKKLRTNKMMKVKKIRIELKRFGD